MAYLKLAGALLLAILVAGCSATNPPCLDVRIKVCPVSQG